MGCTMWTMASRGSAESWPLPRGFPERLAEALQRCGAALTFRGLRTTVPYLLTSDCFSCGVHSKGSDMQRKKQCNQGPASKPMQLLQKARAAASSSLRPCVLLTTGAMNPPHKDGTLPDDFLVMSCAVG